MKDSTLDVRREEKTMAVLCLLLHLIHRFWFDLVYFQQACGVHTSLTRFEHACVINSVVRRILESKFLRNFNISNQLSCFSLGEGEQQLSTGGLSQMPKIGVRFRHGDSQPHFPYPTWQIWLSHSVDVVMSRAGLLLGRLKKTCIFSESIS